ncbi:hypothetical protein PN476_16550, partial [Dolichospermum circinale CS-537/05]|nr:hypothetical protein [Dolichospermum circinale CS-537/05]
MEHTPDTSFQNSMWIIALLPDKLPGYVSDKKAGGQLIIDPLVAGLPLSDGTVVKRFFAHNGNANINDYVTFSWRNPGQRMYNKIQQKDRDPLAVNVQVIREDEALQIVDDIRKTFAIELQIHLITGKTNINNSAAVKQTQSQVTQPAVYKPQNQPVITQPSGLYTNTTTSSPVKQTPSQISQTTHSTNLPNSSRRRFLQILGLTGFGFALVMTGERVLDREKPQPSPLPTSVEKVLKSPVIDYTELIVLLSAGKWKEADQETQRVMLSVTKLEN